MIEDKLLEGATQKAKKLGFDSPYQYLVSNYLQPLGTVGIKNGNYDIKKGIHDIQSIFKVSRKLRELGDEAIPYLIKYLTHEDKAKRMCCATTLGNLKASQAVPALCQALLKDIDEEVRYYSANALKNIGSFQATKALTSALDDDSEIVRQHAAEALSKVGHGTSIEPFIKLLKDPNKDVRRRAVYSLAKIKDPAIVEPLLKCINDNDYGISWGSIQGLKKFPEIAFEGTISALDGKGRYRRQIVITLLGHFKNKRGVPYLRDFMKNSKNKEIRALAAESLGKIKDR